MELYKGSIPIIDFDAARSDLSHPPGATFGMTVRDYTKDPEAMFAPPSQLVTIPQSEWDARFDEQEASESSLEHIYLRGGQPAFVNLDQDQMPDCWCYSTGHAIMLDRLKAGLPVVRLSPSAAATLMGQLQGGWCGKSAQFATQNGYPLEGTGPGQWPAHSRNGHDTPELRAAMALHKITEDWYDLTRQVYDQQLTTLQLATLGFSNIPAPSDFNWWSHSVCQVRWVRIEKGSWGPLILNSWLNWGRFGLAVLRGSQAIANNAVAVRSSIASIT